MTSPKTKTKKSQIHLYCTPEQKARIEAQAKAAGATTLNQYLLTLALNGNTDEFSFLRRKAEGALVNGEIYLLLQHMEAKLNVIAFADDSVCQALRDLLRQTRREIALSRFAHQLEEHLEN